MKITLAPCDVRPDESRLVLDLSELTAEDIRNTITDWTEENNIDEWTVSAFDEEFEPVADSTDPEVWAAWEEAFEKHGDAILKFWDGVLGFTYCKDVAKVLEDFECAYQGEYYSNEDWAVEHIHDRYTLEGPIEEYIDYKRYARDCVLVGDIRFINADNGKVFAFSLYF